MDLFGSISPDDCIWWLWQAGGAEAGLSWGPPWEVLCPKPFCQSGCSWSRSGPGYVPGELCPKAALAGVATESRGRPQNDIAGFPEFGKGPSSFPLFVRSFRVSKWILFLYSLIDLLNCSPLFPVSQGRWICAWALSNISPCCRLPGWWWGSCGILCLHLSCLFLCGPSMCSNCSFRPQVFFRRNHSVCKYRFDVLMGGGELRAF